jgi:hypothetical protein
LPAGDFGETYVITTGTVGENGTHLFESFVVPRRHEPHVHYESILIKPGDVPDKLLTIDENCLHMEARQQVQLYLDDALRPLDER